MEALLAVFWIGSWLLIAMVYTHAVALSFFGLHRWKPEPEAPPAKRFAVIIPAHDEEKVLGALLQDLARMDYPSDLFATFVVADNCTDRTAEVAASYPGVRVIARDGGAKGKGVAMRAAIQQAWDDSTGGGRPFDAFVFFDADNRVSRSFLTKVNNALCTGHQFIQGHLGTKNPYDNWVTRVIYQSYCMTNRLWQLGKRRSGLPSQCGGTGFCLDAKVLREVGWPMATLTEDLEMVCLLALRGIFPVWVHDAVVYDEKPRRVRIALRQRVRWMRGHFANLARYIVPLTLMALRRRDPRILDCALYLLYPLSLLAVGVQSAFWLANILHLNLLVAAPGLPVWLLIVAMLTYYPVAGIYLETRSLKELAYLPLLFAFNWLWVIACFVAVLTPTDRRWFHTPHDASLGEGIHL